MTVTTEKYGVFNCKPLAFIWAKFPEHYNEHNTVMLDDLRWGVGVSVALQIAIVALQIAMLHCRSLLLAVLHCRLLMLHCRSLCCWQNWWIGSLLLCQAKGNAYTHSKAHSWAYSYTVDHAAAHVHACTPFAYMLALLLMGVFIYRRSCSSTRAHPLHTCWQYHHNSIAYLCNPHNAYFCKFLNTYA